jgi:hypothetical protein
VTPTCDRTLGVLEVLDVRIATWEEQALMPCVAPPDAERWATGWPGRQHFGVAVRLTDSMRPDHDPISNFSSHDDHLRIRRPAEFDRLLDGRRVVGPNDLLPRGQGTTTTGQVA